MANDENTTQDRGTREARPGRSAPSKGSAPRSTRLASASNSGRSPRRPDLQDEAPHARVAIELTKAQVDQVIRTAGEGGTMSVLLSALRDPALRPSIVSTYPQEMSDRRLSRSLLAGLYVLSCFPLDGRPLGVGELAQMLDMSASTSHRYISTLTAVGLLERDPVTRRYRLAATQ